MFAPDYDVGLRGKNSKKITIKDQPQLKERHQDIQLGRLKDKTVTL
jgi:hypothetical protein